jgi:WbqC-like protein
VKTVGIIQGNYIPWPGYFEFIQRCDEFIVLDDVQYTQRDWRNRNKISGGRWLTIPVKAPHRARIDEVEVSDSGWSKRHWDILRLNYRKSPFFSTNDWIERLYRDVSGFAKLASVNLSMTREICERLEIGTPIYSSGAFGAQGTKSQRLVNLCKRLNATRYLSGPSARDYLDEEAFKKEGIEVRWMQYSGWPKLSIVDWVYNHGCSL